MSSASNSAQHLSSGAQLSSSAQQGKDLSSRVTNTKNTDLRPSADIQKFNCELNGHLEAKD